MVGHSPEEMQFEDNLHDFAQKVGIIVALESNLRSTMTPSDAYSRIKKLWKSLKKTKKSLLPKTKPEKSDEE